MGQRSYGKTLPALPCTRRYILTLENDGADAESYFLPEGKAYSHRRFCIIAFDYSLPPGRLEYQFAHGEVSF
jgi:hypothetical protein